MTYRGMFNAHLGWEVQAFRGLRETVIKRELRRDLPAARLGG